MFLKRRFKTSLNNVICQEKSCFRVTAFYLVFTGQIAFMQKVFLTGAAGFIGSNLVDRLLAEGATVTGWDNLSTGQIRFLDGAIQHPKFTLIRGDNLDLPALTAAMRGADFVFHFAANADIKDGWQHPRRDLEQNTIATFNVLEAMRANGVKRIAFSSTGSVYGEALVTPERPTPETISWPEGRKSCRPPSH